MKPSLYLFLALAASPCNSLLAGDKADLPKLGDVCYVDTSLSFSMGGGHVIGRSFTSAEKFTRLLVANDLDGYFHDCNYATGYLIRPTWSLKIIGKPVESKEVDGLSLIEVRILEGRWKNKSGYFPHDLLCKSIKVDEQKMKDIDETRRRKIFDKHCECWNKAIAAVDKAMGLTDKMTGQFYLTR